MLPAASNPYRVTAPDATAPLRQCEIVTNLYQFRLDVGSLGTDAATGTAFHHPFALILNQDCDLDQDFRVRSEGKMSDKLLPGILLCEVSTADELFGIIRQTNKKLWDRIKINKDERYHFLQRVELVAFVVVCRDNLNIGGRAIIPPNA